MNYHTDLMSQHTKRITRAGKDFWKQFCEIKKDDTISGELAILLCDNYGIRALDLILFIESKGAHIDMETFYSQLSKREERQKQLKLCNKD